MTAPHPPGHTFSKLIERMEDLILAGTGIPLTPWTVINADRVVPLLDRIREYLPEELSHAQDILVMRDELISEAKLRADNMISDARVQATQLVSESELLRTIQHEAEEIRTQIREEIEALRSKTFAEVDAMKAQAYEEARLVKEGAEQYAESILNNLDDSLADVQTVVRNGQTHLKQGRRRGTPVAGNAGPGRRPVGTAQSPVAPRAKTLPPDLKESMPMTGTLMHERESSAMRKVSRPGQQMGQNTPAANQ